MRPAANYTPGKAYTLIGLTVFLVLLADQWLKIHIKTHFLLGEEVNVIGGWFKLHFTENPGMAFGLSLGGNGGKIVLTVFRLIASGAIIYYLYTLVKEGARMSLLILVGIVLAGALGNIIDSLIYGQLFSASGYHMLAEFMPEDGGYAPLLMGKVVDMLYFPLIDTFWPDWVPLVGGNRLEFFRPVFNIADAAISTGVAIIIVFRRRLFAHQEAAHTEASLESGSDSPDHTEQVGEA